MTKSIRFVAGALMVFVVAALGLSLGYLLGFGIGNF